MRSWRHLLAGLIAVAAGVFYLTHSHAEAPQLKGQAPAHLRIVPGIFGMTALPESAA